MRFDLAEFQALAKHTEIVHFDFMVAADVDATQQANEYRHAVSIALMVPMWLGGCAGRTYANEFATSILEDG